MHKIKPNFLIVGAAKAGTTALYYYLKQHPEIGFPDLKEPKYFSSSQLEFPHNGTGDASVDKYAIKNWNEYLSLFEKLGDKKLIGEASPDYLFYHSQTAPLIKEKLGDIPIIIILRNPVKRAFSAYSYLKRDSREKLDFSNALISEVKRTKENWDFIWRYKQGSQYADQVLTFKNLFSKVHVIIFEDFIENGLEEANKVFSFLELDILSSINMNEHNVSGQPTNWLTKFILSRNNNVSTFIRELLKKTIPRNLLESLSKKSLKKHKIEKNDYIKLKKDLRDDTYRLKKILKMNLEEWD